MNKSALRDEIIACGRDPNYFIGKYVRIRHPIRGLIPFQLFDYQEELVRDYQANRFNIILKARQLGISEITASYAAWLMLFHRDKNILVMASKQETAKNIIRKVNTALKKLPRWLLLADITTDNKFSIELSNGSQIKAIATSEDAGRSEALSLLIIDEGAFVPRFDELWTGLYPTVAAGGRCIVLSTPNGVGNKFHQLYVEAVQETNEFHHTKLMWWRHPERVQGLRDDPDRPGFKTSPWYVNEIQSANMSAREVAQELECNFNASGETVLTGHDLTWIEESVYPPESMEHIDRNLHVWFQPQEEVRYLVTADVARGDGKDNSGAIVWEASLMHQVAEYYGKLPPDEFARVLVSLGRRYGNALLVIENNSIGLACLEHVKLAGYENVYYSRRGDSKPGEAVNTSWGTNDDELIPGFTTSPRTRPLIIAKLEEYIRNRSVRLHSRRLLGELRTFIWNNGRPEAMKGYNDDLTMAAALGAWIRDTFMSPAFLSSDIQKKMLGAISSQSRLNTDINGASKNPDHIRQSMIGNFTAFQNPFEIRMPGGRAVDFSWLIDGGRPKGR